MGSGFIYLELFIVYQELKKKKKKEEEKKAAQQDGKKREKKVYDLPGQKRDCPMEVHLFS